MSITEHLTPTQILRKSFFESNGIEGAKSVTSTPVIAAVSTSNKVSRATLIVTPTNGNIYWGFSPSVTTSSGQPITSGKSAVFQIKDDVTVYLVSGGTVDVRITEA